MSAEPAKKHSCFFGLAGPGLRLLGQAQSHGGCPQVGQRRATSPALVSLLPGHTGPRFLAHRSPHGSQAGRVCMGFGLEGRQRYIVPSAGLMSRLGQGLGWLGLCLCHVPPARLGPGCALPPGSCRESLGCYPSSGMSEQHRSAPLLVPSPASPWALPWRAGSPELPEAARPAQKGLWPMLKVYVPPDILLLSLLLLPCLMPIWRVSAGRNGP